MGSRKRAKHGKGPRASAAPARASATERSPFLSPKLGFLLLALVGAGVAFLALREREAPTAAADVPDPPREGMFAPVARAIDSARAAVLADPADAKSWGELGAIFDAHHLYPEAAQCYGRARALAPLDFRWIYLLAIVSDFQGQPAEEVVASFREAVRLEPDYPPARLRFGDALARQGLLEEARDSYQKAIELDPAFAMAHRNLGQVLLSLEETPAATLHLERARELDPADSIVHTSLARAYFLAGDAEAAQAAEAEAKRLQPVYGVPDPVRRAVDDRALSPRACDERAKERMLAGDFAGAIEDLLALSEVDPDDSSVLSRLGACYVRTGELDEARKHLERAVAQDDLAEAHVQLAAVDEAQGRPADAAEHFRRALATHPDNAGLRKKLGLSLGKAGDLAGAVLEFERARDLGARDAELFHNWGTALDRLGRRDEACTQFEAALALEPDNAGAHFNLALALEALGRIAEAREHYERALALDPRLPAKDRLAALR